MKRKINQLCLFMLLGAALFSTTSCSERVDAGSEGILVNLYGSEKGVDDVSLVTGRVWYNPFTEEVYEYATYVQTIDYPAFTINAKDGSEFTVDPTVSLKMVDGNAPKVFKKYRKELKDIVNGTLFNYVKDAFRIQLNKYTTDQIVSNRDLVEKAIEAQLSKALAKEHFQLEQLTSGLKYPSSIVEAVNQKNKAIQEAQRALNEVAVKKEKDLEEDNSRKEIELRNKYSAMVRDFESDKLRILNLLPNIQKLADELRDDLNKRFFKPKHAIELANSIIDLTIKRR